ncbi:MAG: hypothetical protein HDR94_04770 [Bacteroides sp.]|nr:hypothetical protein [Bacteroides sp.]
MKTSVKILLLVLFSIGAVAGVLVFAKTRVAPPSNLKLVNQYSVSLESEAKTFNDIKDFSIGRGEYIRIDDRLQRFLNENAIDSTVSDEFRKKIDESYGKVLKSYCFDLLQKSVWPEEKLNEMLTMLSSLKSDKLTTGETAVTEDFIASVDKINNIVGEYRNALRFSKNVSFKGVNDASSRIQKAKNYRNTEYLKNNAALVNALDILPSRIAQSHYGHVRNLVNALGNYSGVTKDYYMNTLIPRVDNAITEYKNTKIYGGNKPNITDLENKAVSLVTSAMNYYGDGN